MNISTDNGVASATAPAVTPLEYIALLTDPRSMVD